MSDPKTWNPEVILQLTDAVPPMTPLNHQVAAWEAMSKHFLDHNHQAGMAVMPTGAGKTVTAGNWMLKHHVSSGGRVLWLAHRRGLLRQAFRCIQQLGNSAYPKTQLGMLAVSSNDASLSMVAQEHDVVFLTMQSAVQQGAQDFLEVFVQDSLKGTFVVVDEAHHAAATKRVLVVVAVSVLLVRLEHAIEPWVPFAALIAAMAIGLVILEKREHMAHEISAKLGKVWVFAEIILFAMVGAQVNPSDAWRAGAAGLALIACGLLARGLGTLTCLWGSDLTRGERLFLVVAYSPKATVQAAIGGVPLIAMRAAGMATGPGETILAVAVLSILVTAPAGAWAIATFGERVLPIAPESVRDAYDAVTESQPDDNGF